MSYNYLVHLEVERWSLSRPRSRYAIRKMRKLRKMAACGEIPIEVGIGSGVTVTRVENGRATRMRRVYT